MTEDEIEKDAVALKTDIYDRLVNYDESDFDESDFDEIMYDFEGLESMGIDPFSFM